MGLLKNYLDKKASERVLKNLTEANSFFGHKPNLVMMSYALTRADGSAQGYKAKSCTLTTSAVTQAGRVVDTSLLGRNATAMTCVNLKARTIAQLPLKVMCKLEDGSIVGCRDLRAGDGT